MQNFAAKDGNAAIDRLSSPTGDCGIMLRLFVYGTLAPGRANHDVLADIAGAWQAATLKGRLLQEGWGAEQGCPGIVPAEDGDDVAGYLLTSAQLKRHWARLDAFEGDGYRRVAVSVRIESGERADAYVYALDRDD